MYVYVPSWIIVKTCLLTCRAKVSLEREEMQHTASLAAPRRWGRGAFLLLFWPANDALEQWHFSLQGVEETPLKL